MIDKSPSPPPYPPSSSLCPPSPPPYPPSSFLCPPSCAPCSASPPPYPPSCPVIPRVPSPSPPFMATPCPLFLPPSCPPGPTVPGFPAGIASVPVRVSLNLGKNYNALDESDDSAAFTLVQVRLPLSTSLECASWGGGNRLLRYPCARVTRGPTRHRKGSRRASEGAEVDGHPRGGRSGNPKIHMLRP
eukprot:25736-Prorocentrum_minimum.AAC.1